MEISKNIRIFKDFYIIISVDILLSFKHFPTAHLFNQPYKTPKNLFSVENSSFSLLLS